MAMRKKMVDLGLRIQWLKKWDSNTLGINISIIFIFFEMWILIPKNALRIKSSCYGFEKIGGFRIVIPVYRH